MTAKERRSTPRLVGQAREEMLKILRADYEAGATIRRLAYDHRRSYGGIRALLAESGVTFRARGGNMLETRARACQ